MIEIDLLLRAGWIVPVEPRGVVYEDHCLAVANGRIIDLIPPQEAHLRYRPKSMVRLPEHVLIPGLINAHTHAAMNLFRGLADDLPLMDWLNHHIWPAESKWVDPEFVRHGTQLAIAEMLRGGTTCFSDMYFFPEETARVAREAGIRATIGLIVLDFPTAWASAPDEYLAKGLALHDLYRGNPLIRTAFAPHAPYTVSDAPLRRISVLADELDLPIHIHVHETATEVAIGIDKSGIRPLERLRRLGLCSPRLLAVHATQLSEEDISTLATAGAHVIHCPESNLKLASGFCPIARLAAAEVNVALGTDGAASNNDLDMLGEMRSAALLAKAVAMDAAAAPADEVLRMATLNGARALGLEHEIGSLEPGKSADVVAVDLSSIETRPLYHPVSQLVYACTRDLVTDVWIAGRQVLKQRHLTTLDERQLLNQADVWKERIRATDLAQGPRLEGGAQR
jgi:5-methylthioadenosine/S-adenosylhomocysteine deaminase